MKKLFLILFLCLWSASAFASPFLYCDLQSNTDEFILVFNGVEEIVPYNETDGVVILKDLEGIAEGDHSVSVKASNMWGESSEAPFAFAKTLPGVPAGVGLRR